MSTRLTLHPTAAAAAQALSEAEGGMLLAGDSERGFFAFALEMARRARPFELPDAAERLTLAWAAAERAGLDLSVTAAASFARALSQLHGSGLGTEQLQRLQEPKLAKALEAHRQLLTQRGLCDPGAVPWLAAEAAHGTKQAAASLAIEAVEVLPRIGWTQAELTWLSALAERVPVTVQLPEDPTRPKLFALLNPVHQELARGGLVRLLSPAPDWSHVWAASAAGPSEKIETHSYGSVTDESRGVALQVRRLLRAGVSPDAIAVVALDEPARELAAALDAAGVPVAHVDAALRTTLAGQVALGLIAAADEGVPREKFCELLEGRLLDVRHSLGWAKRLREAGSGPHRQGRLLPPLEALVARKSYDREGLADLAAAVEAIATLPSRAQLGAHARSLWRILRQLGIDARLAKAAPERRPAQPRQLGLFEAEAAEARGFEAPWVEVAQAEATLALDGVRDLLDSFASLESAGQPLTLAELGGFFGAALDSTAAPTARALPGGVTVARAEALSGRRFEHVFLTGLAGDPPPQPEDAFLPERLRHQARELCERPAILAPVGAAVSQDQQLIALAMAAALATERLCASGSRSEAGRLIEPSPLLATLTRLSATGLQSHGLQPWPAGGERALNRGEVCAAIAQDSRLEEPRLIAAEPELTRVHSRLRAQRLARERAILERRIDVFAGDLTAADLTEHLAARLACDAAEPLTATALQTLAGCGFRAFAERVLRIRVPEEQDESIDAGRRGTLLHDCLEHGFRALDAAGLLPLGGEGRRSKQREVFRAAVHARLVASEEAGAVGHPVVWNAQRRGIERELSQVFEAELDSKEAFVPTGFEVKLGTEWPSGVLATAIGPVHLGGKVDRIDVGPGQRLRVLDYKSGSITSRNKRFPREFAGRDLQLGHYALALDLGRRQARPESSVGTLGEASPEASVDAIYYSIRDAKASKSLADVCDTGGVSLEAFLDATEVGRAQARASESPNLPNLIEGHLERARGGQFPVQPGDCRFCAYGSACRAGGFREDWE